MAISKEYVDKVCKPGHGEMTCSFLTMTNGWACAKDMPDVAIVINSRRILGIMSAMGDNCDGWAVHLHDTQGHTG